MAREAAGIGRVVVHDKPGHQVQYFANPRETLVEWYDPNAAVEVA